MSVYSEIVMAIVIGSDEHKDFVSSIAKNIEGSKVFFYKKTQFRGYSSGGIWIGEHKISFPEELIKEMQKDDDVILVIRGKYKYWNSDSMFMEVCQLVDTLKSSGPNMKGVKAGRLCLVLPKEGYVKQDKIFKDDKGEKVFGKSLSIATHRKVLKKLGTDIIISLYPHDFRLPDDKEDWIKTDYQNWKEFAWAVNPVKLIPDYFRKNNIAIDIVVAPDKSAYDFSKYIADSIGADCLCIDSHRSREDCGIVTSKNALHRDLSGKFVLIPDDWILAGGKTKNAIKFVRPKGHKDKWPKEIHIAVIHGEMNGNAYDELMEKDIKLYCTNSVENPAGIIDVTDILADRIKKLFLDG